MPSTPANRLNEALEKYRLPHGKKILIVDDVPDIQLVMQFIFEQSNASVITADTAEEAIERARSDSPDLILMDMKLPDLGGDEAARRIKSNGFKGVIIAITAGGSRAHNFAEACDDYLSKPVDGEVLLRTVHKHLILSTSEGEVP